jgi:hypothetical protein
MALSKKKRLGVSRDALALSKNIDTAAIAVAFQKDYEEIVGKLNEDIDNRLDTFEGSAIKVLRETYQTRPMGCLNVAEEEKDRIRALIKPLLEAMDPLKDPTFRSMAAECVKDIVDICSLSIAEQMKRAKIRSGETTQ